MSLYRILLNRLIILISYSGLVFYIFYIEGLTVYSFFEDLQLYHLLFLAATAFVIFDISKIVSKIKMRNRIFQLAELNEVPNTDPLNRTRMSFMYRYLRIRDRSMEVKKKDRRILTIDGDKKRIVLYRPIGKRIIKFDAIEYLFLEYNHYELDNLLYQSNLDTMVWKNTFKLKLKNGKHVRLFQGKFVEKEYITEMEYQNRGNDEINDYSESGKRVIRLLSYLTNKKYMILNHTK